VRGLGKYQIEDTGWWDSPAQPADGRAHHPVGNFGFSLQTVTSEREVDPLSGDLGNRPNAQLAALRCNKGAPNITLMRDSEHRLDDAARPVAIFQSLGALCCHCAAQGDVALEVEAP
jgi:hypothetical protein